MSLETGMVPKESEGKICQDIEDEIVSEKVCMDKNGRWKSGCSGRSGRAGSEKMAGAIEQ